MQEITNIGAKGTKYQPDLYKQKEFYNLLLFNPPDYIATKSDLVQEKMLTNPFR